MKFLDGLLNWFGCSYDPVEDVDDPEDEFPITADSRDDSYSFSKLAEKFELKNGISDDDFLQVMHESRPGIYEKVFVRVKTLRDCLLNKRK